MIVGANYNDRSEMIIRPRCKCVMINNDTRFRRSLSNRVIIFLEICPRA